MDEINTKIRENYSRNNSFIIPRNNSFISSKPKDLAVLSNSSQDEDDVFKLSPSPVNLVL